MSDAAGDQTRPDAASGVVVWQDHRSGQWDVWVRNLALGPAKRVTTSAARQVAPRICDHWIVWEDHRHRGFGADVYARRARQVWDDGWHWRLGDARVVCGARKDQLEPDVGAGFVVWTDWRNAPAHWVEEPPDTDVRGYEIASRDRFRITGDGMQNAPDLEHLTVVYTSFTTTHMSQPWSGRVKGAHLEH